MNVTAMYVVKGRFVITQAAHRSFHASARAHEVVRTFPSTPIKRLDGQYSQFPYTIADFLARVPELKSIDFEIIHSSALKDLVYPQDNGMIQALDSAYSHHVPLKLGPDAFLLAVLMNFALYSNKHPEMMREFLVGPQEGKLELVAVLNQGVYDESIPEQFTNRMLELINANSKSDILNLFIRDLKPDSTQEQKNYRIAAIAALMGTTKHIFTFRGVTQCGISKVTLDGERADWEDVRERVKKLAVIGGDIAKWSEVLVFVLDQLVNEFDEQDMAISEKFWSTMITSKERGSGANLSERGWSVAFASAFDSEGNYRLNSMKEIKETGIYAKEFTTEEEVPTFQYVPVSWNQMGTELELAIVPLIGTYYDYEENFFEPRVYWAMVQISENSPKSE
jgi:hypothetical protein